MGTMTKLRYAWRPSMYAPRVVHLAREGAVPRTSPEYPGERWVVAACGQRTDPEAGESHDSVRCPECLVWLDQQQDIHIENRSRVASIGGGGLDEPDRIQTSSRGS